jgi:hypothetical protein
VTNVRAPKGGYDTDVKNEYRVAVWGAIAPRVIASLDDERAVCVIMPSREGLEIDVAVSRGIPPEKILCVDQSAAVIATSKWRKRWPQCRFFASKVSAVGEKMKKAGMVAVAANLDLCGNFSDETLFEVDTFLKTAPLSDSACIAVTMMKGREGSVTSRLLDRLGAERAFDEKRLNALFFETSFVLSAWEKLTEGAYKANGMPVAYFAVQKVCRLPESDRKNVYALAEAAARFDNLGRKAWDEWHHIKAGHNVIKNKTLARKGGELFKFHNESAIASDDVADKAGQMLKSFCEQYLNWRPLYDRELRALMDYHVSLTGTRYGCRHNVPKTYKGWGITV